MAAHRSLLLAAVLAASTLTAGCGHRSGSGLLNADATTHAAGVVDRSSAPRETAVYGTRTAITDPREPSIFSGGSPRREDGATKAERPPRPAVAEARQVAGGPEPRTSAKRQPASKGSRPPSPGANVVEVRPGDTLLKVVTRHRVSVAALMSANELRSPTVETGQRIIIPARDGS